MIDQFIKFVQELYGTTDFIPLHVPAFSQTDKDAVLDVVDSTFVSSVSDYVGKFEKQLSDFTGAKYIIPVVNGTSAIHLSLHALGVDESCEVLTQSLTFVATCNAISYTKAEPVFIDIDIDTMGLSPTAVAAFLDEHAEIRDDGYTYNKVSNKRIAACVPMHTFGHPLRIQELVAICNKWSIAVVEDAAEALGSYVLNSNQEQQHCGTFGQLGVLSFNGNKVITTGGGGAVMTNDQALAKRLRHLSTTAKIAHQWEYIHDEVGFNYRLPGLNAALGFSQMQQLPTFLQDKRQIADQYLQWASDVGVDMVGARDKTVPNFWLNAILLTDRENRDRFLEQTNKQGVMTRPVWQPMDRLTQFSHAQKGQLSNTDSIMNRLVNIPSSCRAAVNAAI